MFILEDSSPKFNWQDSLSHAILALLVLAITIAAWIRPKIGGYIFIALGIFFLIFFHATWWIGWAMFGIPVILGILALIEGKHSN
jgi:energy-coupling factor transporter transmembrane protein EcfT